MTAKQVAPPSGQPALAVPIVPLHYRAPASRERLRLRTIALWLGWPVLIATSGWIGAGAIRDGDPFGGTPGQAFIYLWANAAVLLLWAAWACGAAHAIILGKPWFSPEKLLLLIALALGSASCVAQHSIGVQFVGESKTYGGQSWPVFEKLFRTW